MNTSDLKIGMEVQLTNKCIYHEFGPFIISGFRGDTVILIEKENHCRIYSVPEYWIIFYEELILEYEFV